MCTYDTLDYILLCVMISSLSICSYITIQTQWINYILLHDMKNLYHFILPPDSLIDLTKTKYKGTKKDRKCCICLQDNIANIAFLPCRHLVTCNTCAHELQRTSEVIKCPVCRHAVATYLIIM